MIHGLFRRLTFVILLLFAWVVNLFPAALLVEAESFESKGGWVVDQQFMDLMGSPYLMAHGMGVPVEDAYTQSLLPQTGVYHVYVRTYNWTAPWHTGPGPGKFQLCVNDNALASTLGVEGDGWMWQYAGQVSVTDPLIRVSLHDLTGFNGRCDAIYFTTDKDDVPPSDITALDAFRHERLSIAPPTRFQGYDLVVAGAGIAGMSAAVSAARLGCKVALINDRPVVGGNNSSEIRVHLGGSIEIGLYPELGGMQKEFGPVSGGNAQPAYVYEDSKKMDWLLSEPNVDLFLNYRVVGVSTQGDSVTSLTARHIETSQEAEFSAPLFADCTGDGTVGFLAGAHYRMGREGREEHNEGLAPLQADSLTMGASVQWYSLADSLPSTFPLFQYGITFNESNCQYVTFGEWTWETGMNKNQITDFETIRDYGLLVIYSNWSYLKNLSLKKEGYACRSLGWVAYLAGKRESRRLMGDYILTQNDIVKNIAHPDASFTTTWTIDLHRPDSLNSVLFPGNEFIATTDHLLIYPYAVPYRCLYSRNISNLFMAGRNISVTHVALGTTRVMRTTGMMGEVVGMAAWLCKLHNTSPRGVYLRYLPSLRELMERGVNVKGLPNNQRYNENDRLSAPPAPTDD